jgi:hypothetical protein
VARSWPRGAELRGAGRARPSRMGRGTWDQVAWAGRAGAAWGAPGSIDLSVD